MMAPDSRWDSALASAARDDLAQLAQEAGCQDAVKAARNLLDLQAHMQDAQLLWRCLQAAAASADPDQALPLLDRLLQQLSAAELSDLLQTQEACGGLLLLLGGSQLVGQILCRRPQLLAPLIQQQRWHWQRQQQDLTTELSELLGEEPDFATLQSQLRQFKYAELLRICWRDLGGWADVPQITAELSALAAASLHCAWQHCDRLLSQAYGQALTPDGDKAAFVVLGMGKFGGWELNFSSDIDLIYFYSEVAATTSGGSEGQLPGHSYFTRLADWLTKAISQPTAEGFVFRVDLGLRPEGKSGELALSQQAAELYYQSWGQNWERAALLKARPVAGDLAFGEQLLKTLSPFIYRRHLDYGMIDDLKTMKQKIDRSFTRRREGQLNLKLGRGGIREIEFFVQALQLINAGKFPQLRVRGTLSALERLQERSLMLPEDCQTLKQAYLFLRRVEHRIQMVQERQTHNLPQDGAAYAILARRCGYAEPQAFTEALESHRQGVSERFRQLFYTGEERLRDDIRAEMEMVFDPAAAAEEVQAFLQEKGFADAQEAYQTLLVLRDGPPRAHLTRRARRHLERMGPLLLQEVMDSPAPDMALRHLEQFLLRLRARETFFALLAENREIIRLLVNLFATSKYLSRFFIQHPEILDSLVARSHAVASKPREQMSQELGQLLQGVQEYEIKLQVLRRYRNEEFLRIALNDIHGHTIQGQTTRQLSDLAETCLEQGLTIAYEEMAPRFGEPCHQDEAGQWQPTGFAVVGMGKLVGWELTYHSDLDIIFIYAAEGRNRPGPGTESHRFKELSNQEYFSKLAQRLISVLSLRTQEGIVYQIDTQLRPSGNQGPLVTSLQAFRHYHDNSAQIWERQALTRARVVVGEASLAEAISRCVREITYGSALPPGAREEIRRLRHRMETEIAHEERGYNLKTGRGGMVDIEFVVQYLQLRYGPQQPDLRSANTLEALQALYHAGLLTENAYSTLQQGYKFLRRLESKLRLVQDQSMQQLPQDPSYWQQLARRLGYSGDDCGQQLLREYQSITSDIRQVYDNILAPAK